MFSRCNLSNSVKKTTHVSKARSILNFISWPVLTRKMNSILRLLLLLLLQQSVPISQT